MMAFPIAYLVRVLWEIIKANCNLFLTVLFNIKPISRLNWLFIKQQDDSKWRPTKYKQKIITSKIFTAIFQNGRRKSVFSLSETKAIKLWDWRPGGTTSVNEARSAVFKNKNHVFIIQYSEQYVISRILNAACPTIILYSKVYLQNPALFNIIFLRSLESLSRSRWDLPNWFVFRIAC